MLAKKHKSAAVKMLFSGAAAIPRLEPRGLRGRIGS